MNKKKIVVGVTGASGSVYAKVLFDRLVDLQGQIQDVGVVFSTNAREVWKLELGNSNMTP
jgi:4-hydroxy-3-polyprenylbenzoate decarboxylase